MKGILSVVLIYLTPLAYGQAPIVECPIDTAHHFEIHLKVDQTFDDKGEIQTDAYFYAAVPMFYGYAEFKNKETNEDCTPFGLLYDKGQLYIVDSIAYLVDSTGEYRFDLDNTKKIVLNHNRIHSLRIEIRNETNKIVDLGKIDLLKDVNFPINYLEVSFFWHNPKSAKLNIKEWNFIKYPDELWSIYIEKPINQKKKKILRDLNRFENLAKIEIHDFIKY